MGFFCFGINRLAVFAPGPREVAARYSAKDTLAGRVGVSQGKERDSFFEPVECCTPDGFGLFGEEEEVLASLPIEALGSVGTFDDLGLFSLLASFFPGLLAVGFCFLFTGRSSLSSSSSSSSLPGIKIGFARFRSKIFFCWTMGSASYRFEGRCSWMIRWSK